MNTTLDDNRIIRFDWAAKRMLRDKANYDVLEGLVTVLLNEEVHIVELLESEGNQDDANDKFNRVDVMARNSKDEIIIVEIQLETGIFEIEKIIYSNSQCVLDRYDHIGEVQNSKVFFIGLCSYEFGESKQYIYRGYRDRLRYFLLYPNRFNSIATTPLEEWLDYLKNNHIRENTTVPGLQEARKKLQYLQMNREERQAYERHLDNIMVQNDVLDTAKSEGRAEVARNMLAAGMDEETIKRLTGLSISELNALI